VSCPVFGPRVEHCVAGEESIPTSMGDDAPPTKPKKKVCNWLESSSHNVRFSIVPIVLKWYILIIRLWRLSRLRLDSYPLEYFCWSWAIVVGHIISGCG